MSNMYEIPTVNLKKINASFTREEINLFREALVGVVSHPDAILEDYESSEDYEFYAYRDGRPELYEGVRKDFFKACSIEECQVVHALFDYLLVVITDRHGFIIN